MRKARALIESVLTRETIARTIREVLASYLADGRVECAYDVGSGECESFAEDVKEALGSPDGLDAIDYAELTGAGEDGIANEIFDNETLARFGVKLPDGVSVEDLNNSTLGCGGTHIFLRWTAPGGYVWFDAETPDGVDSPFSLPFAERYLKQL